MPRCAEHPEDAYLEELDYDENGRVKRLTEDGYGFKFSERATKAQIAKAKRLYAMFPPSADLDVEDLPRGTKYIPPSVVPSRSFLLSNDEYDPCGNGPWLRHYGWGLTEAFAFDYAKRHALELKLGFPDLIKLAGRPVIPLAELSDDAPEKQVAKLWANIRVMVLDVVLEHVEAQVGFSLELADPFCGDYVSMVALYNNYNIARRHWIIERISRGPIEEVIAKINKIMTPPGEQEWTPMWWYGRENPISIFTTDA